MQLNILSYFGRKHPSEQLQVLDNPCEESSSIPEELLAAHASRTLTEEGIYRLTPQQFRSYLALIAEADKEESEEEPSVSIY